MKWMAVSLTVLALLAGCRDQDRGELTAEENRQLDEAERMLEENGTGNVAEFP